MIIFDFDQQKSVQLVNKTSLKRGPISVCNCCALFNLALLQVTGPAEGKKWGGGTTVT